MTLKLEDELESVDFQPLSKVNSTPFDHTYSQEKRHRQNLCNEDHSKVNDREKREDKANYG